MARVSAGASRSVTRPASLDVNGIESETAASRCNGNGSLDVSMGVLRPVGEGSTILPLPVRAVPVRDPVVGVSTDRAEILVKTRCPSPSPGGRVVGVLCERALRLMLEGGSVLVSRPSGDDIFVGNEVLLADVMVDDYVLSDVKQRRKSGKKW